METKIDKIRAAVAQDDWPTALRIAARFPRLGNAKAAIERGHGALTNPAFYRQVGKDPVALIEEGKRALRERYGL
ncbi:hypothetical protein [Maricaulis sp. MIT060901]|uniref:hypothetical protein n=1 Tax=Maricaulis sp. MIT060901 TaxID=3096993 RepID=UPI00399BD7A2